MREKVIVLGEEGRFNKRKKWIISWLIIILLILNLGAFKTEAKENKIDFTKEKVSFSYPLEISGIGKNECNFSSKACLEQSESRVRKEKMLTYLGDYPMEAMIPFLLEQDEKAAAFLVAIAKKESNWGKRVPRKNGKDCFNYWGFKGNYNLAPSGYSCFDSAEQAVGIVGSRIGELINKGVDTPERMVVWKCGSNCVGHNSESVRSWIGTVRNYYEKLN